MNPMHADTALTVDRTRRVLTERIWPAVHGAAIPLTLTARGGRWEITSVDTALAQTNGAQPTAAPPS